MNRLLMLTLAVAAVLVSMPAVAFAADTEEILSPAQVVEIDRARDGDIIVVEGEAVGDVLRAIGGGNWVNVLGDEVGLGVWMTDDMVDQIDSFGAYQQDGDLIRVLGTVNVTCAQHGGEFDLHAESVEVLEAGEPREHEPRMEYVLVGLAGIVIGGGLWFRYRTVRD